MACDCKRMIKRVWARVCMLAWLAINPTHLDRLISLFIVPPPQPTDRIEVVFMDGPVYHSTRTMVETMRTEYITRGKKVYHFDHQDAEKRHIYQLVT